MDLVYLDPPFNSKADYAAPIGSEAAGARFKDTWTLDDVDLAWHGEIAECEVETKLETDSILFTWRAGEGDAKNTRSGLGGDYLSWEGTATDDRAFAVTLMWGRRLLILYGQATVSPRTW